VFRRFSLTTSLLPLSLLLAFTACDLVGPDDEHFVIEPDSISAPASIGPGDTLRVRFFGSIGPDGCSRMERVYMRLTAAELQMEFFGIRSHGGACTQMPVVLDHAESVPPPIGTSFTITVFRRGPALQRTVTVRAD